MTREDRMKEEAIAWAVRTGDPAFEGWDEFTAWLEANPSHAECYDQVSASLADVAAMDIPGGIANDDDDEASAPPARRRWFALAASIVLVVILIGYAQWPGGSYAVETAPGEVRTLALEDGSAVTLGGGSRLMLDRDDARLATLERGRALFTVRHDAANPFIVHAGGQKLVDAGTVFDVSRDPGTITVAVSEGAVVVNPGRHAERLDPGERLTVSDGSHAYRLGSIDIRHVGEWRTGRLTFDGKTVAEVAAELTRSTGVEFVATPAVARRKVSGSVILEPVLENPKALGELLGVRVRREGDSWVIDSP